MPSKYGFSGLKFKRRRFKEKYQNLKIAEHKKIHLFHAQHNL